MQYNLRNAHICQEIICAERFACGANILENRDMTENFDHIGQVVRKLRKENKLTLIELADQVPDYDAGNLSRFERGEQGINDVKLKELASALGTTVSRIHALMEGEDVVSEKQSSTAQVSGKKPKVVRLSDDDLVALTPEEIDNVMENATRLPPHKLSELVSKLVNQITSPGQSTKD